jgi:hypothetical protein
VSLRSRIVNRWIFGKPKQATEETLWGWIARNAAPDQPRIEVFGDRSSDWITAMAEARAWCRLRHQNVRLDDRMVTKMWIIEDSEDLSGN